MANFNSRAIIHALLSEASLRKLDLHQRIVVIYVFSLRVINFCLVDMASFMGFKSRAMAHAPLKPVCTLPPFLSVRIGHIWIGKWYKPQTV